MDARMQLQQDPLFESILGVTQQTAQVLPLLAARPAIARCCTIFKAASLNGYEVLSENNQFFTHA